MRTRTSFAAIAIAGAVLVAPACSDDTADRGQQSKGDVSNDAEALDAEGDATDPDAAEPDAAEPDAGPDVPPTPPRLEAPEAWVFTHDPTIDPQLTQVVLTPPTSEDGRLHNGAVAVSNCLNEDGGEAIMGGLARLCLEKATVFPDPDGHYLSVKPPANFADPSDPFAEVMMYHHVNQLHHYYSKVHGLTYLDFPLTALVNVQLWVSAEVAPLFGGFGEGWQPFPNAAFMPEEGMEQLGLARRPGGAIVFGQYSNVDFAYDASVIMHEYTHAMIGSGRLMGTVADAYGIDNLPGALNEGFADYFAASRLDNPVVGTYGIGGLDPDMVRDLSERHVCPDDLTTEIHADGKIVGSAMWALREALGAEVADGIILRAIQSMGQGTGFGGAGQLIVAEAELVGQEVADQVEAILTDYGIIGCERAKPWEAFSAGFSGLPYTIPSRTSAPVPGMTAWAPGYLQFYVEVPAGAPAVTLTWEAQGQQGPFGGGGDAKLDVALRSGAPVQFTYGSKAGFVSDAVATDPKVPAPGKGFAMTLTGDCLPAEGGRVYLAFLNVGNAEAAIRKMGIEWPTTADGAINPVTCAP